jgi:hypothetical protein
VVTGSEDELMFTLTPKVGKGFKNIEYEVTVPGGKGGPIGWIKKGWKNNLEGPQSEGVSFPVELDPRGKTLLVGALVFTVSSLVLYVPKRGRYARMFEVP